MTSFLKLNQAKMCTFWNNLNTNLFSFHRLKPTTTITPQKACSTFCNQRPTAEKRYSRFSGPRKVSEKSWSYPTKPTRTRAESRNIRCSSRRRTGEIHWISSKGYNILFRGPLCTALYGDNYDSCTVQYYVYACVIHEPKRAMKHDVPKVRAELDLDSLAKDRKRC